MSFVNPNPFTTRPEIEGTFGVVTSTHCSTSKTFVMSPRIPLFACLNLASIAMNSRRLIFPHRPVVRDGL